MEPQNTLCSEQTCGTSEYSYFCSKCSQPKCQCAEIKNGTTQFKAVGEKTFADTTKKIPLSEQIIRAKNQFKWEILDSKVLLRSFVRALPQDSIWKQRYSDDPSEISKLEQEFQDSYMSQGEKGAVSTTPKIEQILETSEENIFPTTGTLTQQQIKDIVSSYARSAELTEEAAKLFVPSSQSVLGNTNIQISETTSDFITNIFKNSEFLQELEQAVHQKRKRNNFEPETFYEKDDEIFEDDEMVSNSLVNTDTRVNERGIIVEDKSTIKTVSNQNQIDRSTDQVSEIENLEFKMHPKRITGYFKNKDSYNLLLKMHKRYLMTKYLAKHPKLKAEIGNIKNAESVLISNKDFADFISKSSNRAFRYDPDKNIDSRPYKILRNYYTFVLNKDLSSPKQFRELVKQVMNLSQGDTENFEEIPFSDFEGKYALERDIAVQTYKEYWNQRFEQLLQSFENEPVKITALKEKYKSVSVIWETNSMELEEFGLDPNLTPTEASTTSMEELTRSFHRQDYQLNGFVDPNLVIVPSFIGHTELTSQTIADGAMVLKLNPLGEPNDNLLKRIHSRWAQILVERSKQNETYPSSIKIGSSEYNKWIKSELESTPTPHSPIEVLLAYYTEIKKHRTGTIKFAELVISDYEKLYAETRTPLASISFIPAEYFPRTEQGDELWRKYLRMFGHLNDHTNVLEKDRHQFMENVANLRNEIFTLRVRDGSTQDEFTLRQHIESISIIELIKEKIRKSEVIPLKMLKREFPKRVARATQVLLDNYDPEAIEPLQLKDFSSSGTPTQEELQEYRDYMDYRAQAIRSYEKRNKAFARKKPSSPSVEYFKLLKMH